MSEIEDQTLEGGAEGAVDLELEPAEPEIITPETDGTSGDPLDDIRDPEARAEAKKARAISRRKSGKAESAEPERTVAPSEFLTKADFERSNERKAILSVTADADVRSHWDEIRQYYTPRRGKSTPEDIVEDIKDAVILFKARSGPVEEPSDPTAELQSISVAQGTAPGVAKKEEPKGTLPGFKTSTQPTDWYKKS